MKLLTKLIKHINNKHGSTLVIVLFIVILVSVIGFSLLSISFNSLKQVNYEKKDQSVFYIAEAGMNLTKIEIKEQLSIIQKKSSSEIKSWIANQNKYRSDNKLPPLTEQEALKEYKTILNREFSIFNGLNKYTISTGKLAKVTLTTQYPDHTKNLVYLISIVSTGSIDEAKNRIVKQNIEIKPQLQFNPTSPPGSNGGGTGDGHTPIGTPEGYAVLTRGDIIFNDSGKIFGNATLSQGNIVLKNWSASISGVASIDKNFQKIITSKSNQPVPIIADPLNINVRDYLKDGFFPKDKFTSNYINSLHTFENTKINNSNNYLIYNNGNFNAKDDSNAANEYTINLTNHSNIRFKDFLVYSNKTIYIDVGDKDTDLHIDNLDINQGHIIIKGSGKLNIYINKFTALKGAFNNNGNSNQVNFIYNGTNPFKLEGETKIYGSLINNTASISLKQGTAFYGNIISKGTSIDMSGNAPVHGQSVIAPYASLVMDGSAKIYGTTIVDSIILNGGGTEIHYETPIFPLPPGVGPGNPHIDLPAPNNNDFWIDESNMVEQ